MAIISRPNTYTSSTTISSSEVNDDFDTIYNEFNGSIAAANLATDSVTTAKIADANVTNAKLATGINAAKFSNPYKFSVYKSLNQASIADATATKVTWNTERFDTNNNFDNATNYRYTAPIDGFYQINVRLNMLSTGNNAFEAITYLYKNGASIEQTDLYPTVAGTSIILTSTISTLLQLTAGDYLEVFAWMDVASSTVTVVGGTAQSAFSGFLVSAT